MLAMELKDIEREKFDRSLAKPQIRQYFPLSIRVYVYFFSFIHIAACCLLLPVHLAIHFMSFEFSPIHCCHPRQLYTICTLCIEGTHKERYKLVHT